MTSVVHEVKDLMKKGNKRKKNFFTTEMKC